MIKVNKEVSVYRVIKVNKEASVYRVIKVNKAASVYQVFKVKKGISFDRVKMCLVWTVPTECMTMPSNAMDAEYQKDTESVQ